MALDNYSDLKTAIADWLERSDLSSHVDSFIRLAEARHKREIRIREMQQRDTLTIAEDDRYEELSGLANTFLDLKGIRIRVPTTGSGRRFVRDLTQITPDEMVKRSIKDAAAPNYFTVWEDTLEFDTKMDQDYTAEVFYYSELTALSTDNQTNALLTRAPDCYLYAALSATAPFLLNDERIPVWEGLYQQARDTLNRSESESRRGGPLTVRVAGSTP